MAASFPGAVKNFSAIVNGVTKFVAALFNSPYDEITAIETALLATVIHTDGTLKAACINTTALKTATGEVSHSTGTGTRYTLPGGEYGFYPQIKTTDTTQNYEATILCTPGGFQFGTTSYTTSITLRVQANTIYIQQRYVTASGEDMWIFLLVDKTTKEIVGAYQAPDHPAYGNGGDFDKVPHPFGSYDVTKHEIVLVDNDTITELRAQVTQEKSLLTLINEEYKPNMAKEEVYKPLHSGRFINKKPELIEAIPDYITVRKLEKLTQAEKDAKKIKQEGVKQKAEQEKVKKEQNRISAENKLKILGLTIDEINAVK